jgi:hypothetical protein
MDEDDAGRNCSQHNVMNQHAHTHVHDHDHDHDYDLGAEACGCLAGGLRAWSEAEKFRHE